MKSAALPPLAAAALLVAVTPLRAHEGAAVGAPQTILVEGNYDNQVGSSDAASAGTIRRELLESRPAQRPGEVLEFVPGVIVTQHSGDGKANQYFLRGFNLDHGTDFATRLAGMPLNLPTHGHGQGYTDLNFMIPELVGRIEYRKGPYFASVGDFAAAGSADIAYLERGLAPFSQLTLGQNGYRRAVAGGSTDIAPDTTLLAAGELMRNDGPWTVPQGLRKSNGVLTLSGRRGAQTWGLTAMAYEAHWTATDQVPQRLIDSGTFGRYDSLDPTDGGSSRRHSLSGHWQNDGAAGRTRVGAYLVDSALDLSSNFTYALERPLDGDQFKQTDHRTVIGLDLTHALSHDLGPWPVRTEFGLQLRQDRIRVGLYDSVARRITATVREDRVRETMASLYLQTSIELTPELRAVAGLRADHVAATVDALTLPVNGGSASATKGSPKLSLIYTLSPKAEVFANVGRGLHSNDARGMTARVDPKTGDPVDPVPPLVAITGAEVGLRTEPVRGLQSSLSLWALRSDSELVYVGDAGVTEASIGSRRHGVEFSNRWQPSNWLLVDADLAWSHARFEDGGRIPNAVDRVASVAGTVRRIAGWTGSLQWRYLGPGALVADNSARSASSSTFNLRVTRQLGTQASVTLDVFNLFDRKVNDIQYFYASQLPGEAAPVEDRHVHPAEPRSFRLTAQVAF